MFSIECYSNLLAWKDFSYYINVRSSINELNCMFVSTRSKWVHKFIYREKSVIFIIRFSASDKKIFIAYYWPKSINTHLSGSRIFSQYFLFPLAEFVQVLIWRLVIRSLWHTICSLDYQHVYHNSLIILIISLCETNLRVCEYNSCEKREGTYIKRGKEMDGQNSVSFHWLFSKDVISNYATETEYEST